MPNSASTTCYVDAPVPPSAATIKFPRTTLGALPPASEIHFPGLFAWSSVSTSAVTRTLGIDKGLWGTWRNRGITPAPLPPAWFRRASGNPLVYRVDHILTWLAARRGEALDTTTTWWECLRTNFGEVPLEEVRRQAALYARVAGPTVGDVRFTPAGFTAYLAGLEQA